MYAGCAAFLRVTTKSNLLACAIPGLTQFCARGRVRLRAAATPRRGHRPARPRHRTGRPSTIQILTRTSDHEIAGPGMGPVIISTALRRLPDKYGNGCDLWTTRIAADRARTTFPLRWFGHPASGSSRDISLIEVNLGLRGPSPYPSPGCASLAGRGRIRPTAQGRKHARQNLSQTGGTAHHATCRGPVPQ